MDLTGIGAIADLVGKFIPDKTQAEKDSFALQLAQMQADQVAQASQAAINTAEASNQNVFVAGWRPAIGWSCAGAFSWSYVLAPLASFFAEALGHPVHLPALDISGMMPVLLGMLGLGTMRTFEKVSGVKTGH